MGDGLNGMLRCDGWYACSPDPADRTGGKLPGRHHHVALMPRERLNLRFALLRERLRLAVARSRFAPAVRRSSRKASGKFADSASKIRSTSAATLPTSCAATMPSTAPQTQS